MNLGIKLTGLVSWVLVSFFLGSYQPAYAFKLVPITMDFEPSGQRASQSFRIENETDQTAAVQVSMLTREMDLHGKEVNSPADDDFIVYPTQILLKPKQTQVVRVKWVGNARPEKELAYRILAEQLPVDLDKEKAGGLQIKVVVRYLGTIYIAPKGVRPDLVVASAQSIIEPDGARKLEIIFQNRGKAHALLSEPRLQVKAGDKTILLGTDELKGLAGQNILAGNKRRFLLPWPADLPHLPLQVDFSLSGGKPTF